LKKLEAYKFPFAESADDSDQSQEQSPGDVVVQVDRAEKDEEVIPAQDESLELELKAEENQGDQDDDQGVFHEPEQGHEPGQEQEDDAEVFYSEF